MTLPDGRPMASTANLRTQCCLGATAFESAAIDGEKAAASQEAHTPDKKGLKNLSFSIRSSQGSHPKLMRMSRSEVFSEGSQKCSKPFLLLFFLFPTSLSVSQAIFLAMRQRASAKVHLDSSQNEPAASAGRQSIFGSSFFGR